MNPPNVPNHYKNFLPSRTFLKTLVGIITLILVIFLIPKLIKWIDSHKSKTLNQLSITATNPSGDPTTRDSSGTGIPDWELIAAGIDPQDPNAVVEFEKAKSIVGTDNFQTTIDNASDSDKVGLVMYDDLSNKAVAAGATSSADVSNVTADEVTNYITAQQAKNKTYSQSDLTISDNSDASIQKYYDSLIKSNPPSPDQDFITHVTDYIQGKDSKATYIGPDITAINSTVTTLLATPVPPTAVAIHLAVINAMSGLAQTLEDYDPTTTDNLSQLGTVSLVENYYRADIAANAELEQYFSIALPQNSSSK